MMKMKLKIDLDTPIGRDIFVAVSRVFDHPVEISDFTEDNFNEDWEQKCYDLVLINDQLQTELNLLNEKHIELQKEYDSQSEHLVDVQDDLKQLKVLKDIIKKNNAEINSLNHIIKNKDFTIAELLNRLKSAESLEPVPYRHVEFATDAPLPAEEPSPRKAPRQAPPPLDKKYAGPAFSCFLFGRGVP